MIKTIELKNFQKHSNLKVDLVDGVNVVYGKSDAGKSCLVRAIDWVCYSGIQGDVIRKEGSKETSVKITLDNGVGIERVKSTSKNRYILYRDNDKKEYNKIGREVPDDIKNVLGLSQLEVDNESINLNIANQISLPFLLDKPATFRMKLFNKITGSDILDNVFKSLNSDLLGLNRKIKTEKERLEELNDNLKEVNKEKDRLKPIQDIVNNLYSDVQRLNDKKDKLKKYKSKLANNNKELENTNKSLNSIREIDKTAIKNLKDKVDKYNKLKELNDKYSNLNSELGVINKKLKEKKIPTINFKNIYKLIEKKNKLEQLELEKVEEQINNIIIEIDNRDSIINKGTKEYKTILKDYGKCPTCQTVIDEKILKKISLGG